MLTAESNISLSAHIIVMTITPMIIRSSLSDTASAMPDIILRSTDCTSAVLTFPDRVTRFPIPLSCVAAFEKPTAHDGFCIIMPVIPVIVSTECFMIVRAVRILAIGQEMYVDPFAILSWKIDALLGAASVIRNRYGLP